MTPLVRGIVGAVIHLYQLAGAGVLFQAVYYQFTKPSQRNLILTCGIAWLCLFLCSLVCLAWVTKQSSMNNKARSVKSLAAVSAGFAACFTTCGVLLKAAEISVIGSSSEFDEALWASAHVPSFSTSSLLFTPIFVSSATPDLPKSAAAITWICCLSATVVSVVLDDSIASLFEVGHGFLFVALGQFTILSLADCARAELAHSAELCQAKISSSETQMKHILGNMAHDLKTPLTSFMAGIANIEAVVDTCEAQLRKKQLDLHDVEDWVTTSKQCLAAVSNTNKFMLMTIHRVLDYTKISKGLKLIPKYETVDLVDALRLPLDCMKDIQERIDIHLEPMPQHLCSHVITDKQWLQENVLCLLSNAVKYSNAGLVSVRVQLETVPLEPATRSMRAEEDNAEGADDLEEDALDRMSFSGGVTAKRLPARRRCTDVSLGSIAPLAESSEDLHASISMSPMSAPRSRSSFTVVHNTCLLEVLRVEVEDTGIGMSPQDMADLFSPFMQTQRLAGGTGLGLFSLARRVNALRGSCGVSSRRDGRQGSLFWFQIPYRPDPEALAKSPPLSAKERPLAGDSQSARTSTDRALLPELPSARKDVDAVQSIRYNDLLSPRAQRLEDGVQAASATGTHLTGRSDELRAADELSILLVDDSPTVLRMVAMMLRRQGHHVTVAENGAVAVALLEARLLGCRDLPVVHGDLGCARLTPAFDVILMDLQMPVMDGLESAKRLRELEMQINCGMRSSHLANSSRSQAFPRGACAGAIDRQASTVSAATMVGGQGGIPELRHLLVGLSANTDEDTIAETALVGFDGFLGKPFTIEAFRHLMDSLLLH